MASYCQHGTSYCQHGTVNRVPRLLSRSKMLSAPDLVDLIGLRSERSRRPSDSAQGLIAGRTLRWSKPARDVAAEWGRPGLGRRSGGAVVAVMEAAGLGYGEDPPGRGRLDLAPAGAVVSEALVRSSYVVVREVSAKHVT